MPPEAAAAAVPEAPVPAAETRKGRAFRRTLH